MNARHLTVRREPAKGRRHGAIKLQHLGLTEETTHG